VIDASLIPYEKFKLFEADVIKTEKDKKEHYEFRVLGIEGGSDVLFY
jgi:hypothetical protein